MALATLAIPLITHVFAGAIAIATAASMDVDSNAETAVDSEEDEGVTEMRAGLEKLQVETPGLEIKVWRTPDGRWSCVAQWSHKATPLLLYGYRWALAVLFRVDEEVGE